MFSEKLLAGRRILVTGGGTGLGKSMAARFLALGADIHICGRRKGVCDETATELMDLHGGRVTSHGVDIRDAPAVDRIMKDLASNQYRFSALVLGIVKSEPFQMRAGADSERTTKSNGGSNGAI